MAWPESVSLVILFFVREIAFLGSSFTTHFYSLKRPNGGGACLPSAL